MNEHIISKKTLVVLASLSLLTGIVWLLDTTIFNAVFSIKQPLLDDVMIAFSNLKLIITLLFVIPSLLLLRQSRRTIIPFLWASLAASFFISFLLKDAIGRLRPLVDSVLIPLLDATSFSFPSGHAAIAFASVPILGRLYPRLRWLFITYASMIALSRIYVGVHYPSDVLAGVVLGLLVGYLLLYFKEEKISDVTLEVKRQIFHIFNGTVIVMLLKLNYIAMRGVIILLVFGIALSFLYSRRPNSLIEWFLRNFDRSHRVPGYGAITFFVGILATLVLFGGGGLYGHPSDVALASIMILTFGDAAATIVGKSIGRVPNPLNRKKTVEGSIAGIIFGAAGALFFVPLLPAIAAAVVAMTLEAVKSLKIDDNIVVPLAAGIVLSLI
ncbi:MAG: phosphatase PAP2 family protein [Nanoarchaeota archaeon]